jgi:hypothetical protein
MQRHTCARALDGTPRTPPKITTQYQFNFFQKNRNRKLVQFQGPTHGNWGGADSLIPFTALLLGCFRRTRAPSAACMQIKRTPLWGVPTAKQWPCCLLISAGKRRILSMMRRAMVQVTIDSCDGSSLKVQSTRMRQCSVWASIKLRKRG